MKEFDVKMQKLIVDHVMLVYLHDLLSLREHQLDAFKKSDVYQVLHEKTLTTWILGFKKTFLLLIVFLFATVGLKQLFNDISTVWQLINISLIVVFYGVGFFIAKKEYSDIKYQLRLKAACQYALNHYNYDEFVIFLDQYLSIQSTQLYLQNI